MLIDSHCHLEKFFNRGELDAVLQRANAAGVQRLITVGTGLKDWQLYFDLAARHPQQIYWTVGIHPCSVDENWDDAIKVIPSYFATDPLPVALGEIGLDHFHLPKYPDEAAELKAMQAAAFRQQLAIAHQLDCPVVIHSRNAFDECVQLIDESGVNWNRVIFHCFSEGPESMRVLIDRGGWASFTGIVTYKSAQSVREAMKLQGLDRLILETDAPYLTPEPHRGKGNEPAFVRHTAECCAEEFSVEFEQLAAQSTQNAERFFQLNK